MGIPINLRVLLLCLAPTTAIHDQVDAREIIRHAVVADELNWRTARKYTFLQRDGSFIIEAIPPKGYQPRSSTAKLFRSLKGRFWVDQQGRHIAGRKQLAKVTP